MGVEGVVDSFGSESGSGVPSPQTPVDELEDTLPPLDEVCQDHPSVQ